MKYWMITLLLGGYLASVSGFTSAAETPADAEYKEVYWEDLMPEGWEPPAEEMPVPPGIADQLVEQGLEFSEEPLATIEVEAPIIEAFNNTKLKVPGFIIPIKYDDESLSEFLLVPFMGACIHVPPPPSNQMVYVILKEPMSSGQLWMPVWASGVMHTEKSTTEYATAGYTMTEAVTSKYEFTR